MTDNTAIGAIAGESITSGSYNTLLGSQCGHIGGQSNNLTTGNNNVLIGFQAMPSSSGASNQIVIGQGATGQGDNKAVIGNADVTDVYMAQDGEATLWCGAVRRKKHTHGKSSGTDYGGHDKSILVTNTTYVSTTSTTPPTTTAFVSTTEIIVLRIDMSGGVEDQDYYIQVESNLITNESMIHKSLPTSRETSGTHPEATVTSFTPAQGGNNGVIEVKFGIYTGAPAPASTTAW